MANERKTTTRDNGKYEGLTLCSYHPTIGRWRGSIKNPLATCRLAYDTDGKNIPKPQVVPKLF